MKNLYILFAVLPIAFSYVYNKYQDKRLSAVTTDKPRIKMDWPSYDLNVTKGNVSVGLGQTLQLSCRIHNLGNRTVSWIRESTLLTVGRIMYSTDTRFEILRYPKDPADFTITVKYAQMSDGGNYYCIINTDPHQTFRILVNVVEVQTMILGEREVFADAGTTVNLTCMVIAPIAPFYVIWIHNDSMVKYEGMREGITVNTTHGVPVTRSELIIRDTRRTDNGVYSCEPAGCEARQVYVTILNDNAVVRDDNEYAAIQGVDGIIYESWLIGFAVALTLYFLF